MDNTTELELLAAIKEDDVAKVRALLKAAGGPIRVQNESGVSAVVLAVYYGRRPIAEALAAQWPPLDIVEAAALGSLARVRELVAGNRDLARVYSPDGFPVVGLAATFGHPEIVTFLIENGADVNAVATNGTGYNALTGSVSQRRRDITKILLDRGANADYRYGPGWSPLHEAAMDGDAEVAAMLLDHGADPNAKNAEGKTPLGLAAAHEKTQVAEILRARGAVE
jgi:ankyrin repeat protein